MSVNGNRFSSLTLVQLNELLEDEEKLSNMVQEMDEVQNVKLMKEMTLASNRSLAEQNLLHQPTLDRLKVQVTKKYCQLQEQFEKYQMRKTTLDHQSSRGSIDTLLALLQAEGAKIEEETENMAEMFLEGESSLDSFIDEYQSKRKLAHLRRVKIDKLREMVLKGHRLPQAPAQAPLAPEATPAPQTPPSFSSDSNIPPLPMPRRAPPAPPAMSAAQPTPFTAAMQSGPAPLPYPVTPYPPIPPRVGNPLLNQPTAGYPNPFLHQYPPALPQRPPPHLAPQPGFIMQ
ncbi:vacuolar protein sorting-associated protein 37B-like [Polyodon spathula]|uniref:vacuolar protein sorting-associated protein 37B-like n=1 Tax=Polyodon spathula TaxID=7913 RepID=UPI001B7ECD74|nr:vacuolar protein sorting-associated protein 37B-like [Polyodon spathula]